jgi:hypothetical protein
LKIINKKGDIVYETKSINYEKNGGVEEFYSEGQSFII